MNPIIGNICEINVPLRIAGTPFGEFESILYLGEFAVAGYDFRSLSQIRDPGKESDDNQ